MSRTVQRVCALTALLLASLSAAAEQDENAAVVAAATGVPTAVGMRQAHWLRQRKVAYWGDMDTWGLLMLARARQYCPNLTALLMEQTLFDEYADGRAVAEPAPAQKDAPEGLKEDEARFYGYLLRQARGRLEQEYLPGGVVREVLVGWCESL